MADYKELLRRAISALPENNGAARRAVYEKARAALVGQLRSIQPPLPAREITQHRLQLEDCIRQVEQEASEAVISLGRDGFFPPRPAPADTAEPEPETVAAPVAAPVPPPKPVEKPATPVKEAPAPVAVAPKPEPANPLSIEEIITEAATTSGAKVQKVVPGESAEPTEDDDA